MWDIELDDKQENRILTATRVQAQGSETSFVKKISLTMLENAVRITVKIKGDAETLAQRIDTRVVNSNAAEYILSETKQDGSRTLKITVSIKTDYTNFAKVFKCIDDDLQSSNEIRKQLPAFLAGDKSKKSATHASLIAQFRQTFESYYENVMSKTLMASVRQSLKRLKSNYPALSAEEEMAATNRFINRLITIQEVLIRQNYLEYDKEYPSDTTVKLTGRATQLILQPTAHDKPKEIDRAKFAFNVKEALQSLFWGIHSDNANEYKISSLVAFLYNCCQIAEKNKSFAKNVSFRQAVDALINAIAQGAREKAREDVEFDSLEEGELHSCPEGTFKFLITGLEGVFTEIKIIYEWLDLLLAHLREEIVRILINQDSCNNIQTADLLLKMWNGSELEPSPNQKDHAYNIFKNQVLLEFNDMIKRFANKYFYDEPQRRQEILREITEKVNELKAGAFVEDYITLVSPSSELLYTMWKTRTSAFIEPVKIDRRIQQKDSGQHKRCKHAFKA